MIKKKYEVKLLMSFVAACLLFPNIPMKAHQLSSKASEIKSPTQTGKKVSVVVQDDLGEPLVGVSVAVKNTTKGTITDLDGKAALECSADDTLVITYIGFNTQELKVGNQSDFKVVMIEDSKQLEEVIVIGYGTTTRKTAVGSVDQVKKEMIEDRPVANLTQALQGAAPNLVIQQKSQNPNDNKKNMNIRGVSTFNDNSPLIVIDGMISDEGSFDKINPNDVENVSILKDAGTAAIYGSRSANGVILITTKQGKKNQAPSVRLSSMVGWQDPTVLFRPLEGYQNATMKNTALTNVGKDPEFSPSQVRDMYTNGSSEWFFDQILRTALQQNYNLSVSGGGSNNTYMISLGYYDQQSNFVGRSDYGVQRYNMRANLTTEYKRFKLTGILAYTRNNSMKPGAGNLEIDASRVPRYPHYSMKAEDGRYLLNDVLSQYNPLGMLEAGGAEKHRNNYITANVNVEFSLYDGLKLRGVLGADVIADHRFTRQYAVPFYASETVTTVSRYGNSDRETSDWNHDATFLNSQILADYNKTFGKHTISGLLGATNESVTKKSNEIKVKYAEAELGTTGGDGSVITVGGGSSLSNEKSERTSITSVLGRAGYSYDDKYYAEMSFRYDGSSKFDKSNRWGFFPSVSLGWRLSEESFMESYKANIGELKLRGSYGILGNQSIGTYDRYTIYEMHANKYAFNNQLLTGTGFKLGDKNLKWEKTNTFNIGVDAQFLNNALGVTLEYFHKKTTGILMKPVVPSVFGTEYSMANIGEMKNQGWDASINYFLRTGEMSHNFGLSVGDNWNEVTKFEGYEEIKKMEELGRLTREGVSLNSYYGYKTDGLFQSYEEIALSAIPVGAIVQPGDVKFVDRNGDGVIDSKDRYILGNAFPRLTFGFTYRTQFKGFDFSMLWQGVGKRDMMVRGELVEPFHANYSYNIYKHQLDTWTPTNTDAKWPRLAAPGSSSNANNYGQGSDIYIYDAKYIRLKNIQIGYTIPKNISTRAGMQKVRVYMNAQNLFTFSNTSFIDPESSEFDSKMSSDSANSGRNYPFLKYYGFGLDIQF